MSKIEELEQVLNNNFDETNWIAGEPHFVNYNIRYQLVKHNNRLKINVKGSGEITEKGIITKKLPRSFKTIVSSEENALKINKKLREEFKVGGTFIIKNIEPRELSVVIDYSDVLKIFNLVNTK
jgi:hypothetical protein